MGNKVIILGEMHTVEYVEPEDILVGKLVKMGLCDCLLLENAYDLILDTPEKIQKALDDEYFMVSPDLYELAVKYNLPVYGIDAPESLYKRRLTMRQQFDIREKRMVEVIEEHRVDKHCVVIVGDTHLRTRRTQQLGPPSPLYKKYIYDPDVYIVRADIMEREADWARNVPYTFTWDDALSGRMFQMKERYNKTNRSMGRIKDENIIYHISLDANLPKVLKPRQPTSESTVEEDSIFTERLPPRVSFGRTFVECWAAIYAMKSVSGQFEDFDNPVPYLDFYVYGANYSDSLKTIPEKVLEKNLHDYTVTREICVLNPVKIFKCGVVRVFNPELNKPIQEVFYNPFNKKKYEEVFSCYVPNNYEKIREIKYIEMGIDSFIKRNKVITKQ